MREGGREGEREGGRERERRVWRGYVYIVCMGREKIIKGWLISCRSSFSSSHLQKSSLVE